MERNIRVLSPDVLLEEYRELLEDERVEALPLLISGNSMSPFLVDGRDTVYLSRLTKPVKKGDVIVITGGTPNGESGNSNLINVETI